MLTYQEKERRSENPPSTVPVSILATTSARPDMVLIRSMEITLIELTVPYDSREHLNNARARKSQKSSYLELLSDLKATRLHLLPVRSPDLVTLSQSVPKLFMNFFLQFLAPPSMPCSMLRQKLLSPPPSRYSWPAEI